MSTTPRSDDLRHQVNELFKQTISELEDMKELLLKKSGRFEEEVHKLRKERDRLLKTLGEQTYRLANQGKLPMPAIVKTTVDRLNEVIDRMVAKENGKKKPAAKKARAKKAPRKRSPRAASSDAN